MRLAIIQCSGRPDIWVQKPFDRNTWLKELQGYVGGYVEHVPMPESFTTGDLYANEEGRLYNLKTNRRAGTLMMAAWLIDAWHRGGVYTDLVFEMMVLCGNVVWCVLEDGESYDEPEAE